jgi:hypothetical protein
MEIVRNTDVIPGVLMQPESRLILMEIIDVLDETGARGNIFG